jgi:uroporphyrin-III C-methyltransferase
MTTTTVHLVGAGPGDPELMTLKGLRLVRTADAVVYDRLVSDEILAEISEDAARIYVGKQGGTHSIPQEEINALLIDLASKYDCVVRLKGGDPYVFGRGAEEAMALVAAGVEFQVVPGITAATGIMAGIGLPLTHRGVANGVRFVTAQCGKNVPLELNWDSLADPDTTLVVYMGLAKLPEISEKLIAAGMPAEQPAMAVSKGTTDAQVVCSSTLSQLPLAVRAQSLVPPVLIVIGKIADLAGSLGLSVEENVHNEE